MLQTVYSPRFLGAIGRPDLGFVVHKPPHSFGLAAHAGDHQRLPRECRSGPDAAAASPVEEPRTGCRQACCDDSPPGCSASAEVQAECLGQKIGSFDVGKEDMQARSWRVSMDSRLLDRKWITGLGRVLPIS